ncbi:MAG: hypothetical protein ACM3NT_08305 [Methylocystaceae bacterium]
MSKKRKWLYGIIGIMVLLGLTAGWVIGQQKRRVDPDLLLKTTLSHMNQVESFRYELQSELKVADRREVISKIQGERAPGGAVHIKGEMVKSPVDIYYINNVSYNYDPYSKRWLVVEDAASNVGRVLVAELSPLSNFSFKEVNSLKLVNFEKVDGYRCAVLTCSPSLENELMKVYWDNFHYRLWCEPRQNVLLKAELSAVSKHNPNTVLNLEVRFSDIGKPITINKPQ